MEYGDQYGMSCAPHDHDSTAVSCINLKFETILVTMQSTHTHSETAKQYPRTFVLRVHPSTSAKAWTCVWFVRYVLKALVYTTTLGLDWLL